jgi:hypothetical protein
MGWRGLARPCRTSLAGCPACPAATAAPPGPGTRAIHQFPGSSHVPGVSTEWRPFPAVKAFLRLPPAAAQEAAGHLLRLFCCPQHGGSYPQLNAVIHRIAHKLSTERARRGAQEAEAARGSEAGQSAFGDFCRRVVSWAGARFGHNKTRPPPFMGWRGPCAVCRTIVTSCPARPAKSPPRQGQTPARFTSFPAPPASPGFPPEQCPFPAVKAFLRLPPAAAQGVPGHLLRLFSLSTARRQLSAIECGYPPLNSQAVHRSGAVH